jgi:hypothetical protein
MGDEKKGDVIEELEDILGLSENATPETIVDEEEEPATVEVSKTTTTLVTPEQNTINKDIARLDIQIEELEKATVDSSAFYDNLETELSEDEQALEFSDKSAYMKVVASKAKEYESKNSKSSEIEQLKEQKEELSKVYERQSAIVEVTAKYPDYDHAKVLNFYENELSKSEQDKIITASKSYGDVFENTFKKYLTLNPTNIQKIDKPNIPSINNVRKQNVDNADIDNGLTSHNEQLQSALGL